MLEEKNFFIDLVIEKLKEFKNNDSYKYSNDFAYFLTYVFLKLCKFENNKGE